MLTKLQHTTPYRIMSILDVHLIATNVHDMGYTSYKKQDKEIGPLMRSDNMTPSRSYVYSTIHLKYLPIMSQYGHVYPAVRRKRPRDI